MMKIVCISIETVTLILACVSCLMADTHTAATCSLANVNTALSAAVSGDTVSVPSGTCTWSAPVSITIAISFQGAGVGSTVITGGVEYSPSSGEETKTFEMSGFTFQGTGTKFVPTAPSSSSPITGLKIHGNAFNGSSSRALSFSGLEFGVIYDNAFDGNEISVSVIGADWAGESYSHVFGSANYPYFEDNTFGNGTGSFVLETGQGGRIVFRHNTITGYACSGCEVFDLHGDQDTGGGTISSEIYHNSIDVGSSGTYRWLHHRGGQAIIANNTINRSIDFHFTEYRSWGGNGICTNYPVNLNQAGSTCSPANGTTCIEKQINNSFYFGNISNGSEQTPTFTNGDATGSCGANHESLYIQENREYWLPSYGLASSLPGTCTADGNTYYGATDTDVIYKCTSTNTWTAHYTPYTYPHPLRGGDAEVPVVSITAPTSNATYSTSNSAVSVSGTASDNVGVSSVTWANDRGGSGTATGTTSWSISGIILARGANVITVTATDAAENTGTDALTVTAKRRLFLFVR